MLVDIVELVEFPQCIIPTLVRLDTVDFLYRIGPHSLYFPNLYGFVNLCASTNRKANIPARLDSRTAYEHKLICQVVEGASKVLDNVTSDGN